MSACFKQCAIIEFLINENVSPIKIYNKLHNIYGEATYVVGHEIEGLMMAF